MRKVISLAVFLLVLGVAACKPKPCEPEGKIWKATDGQCYRCENGKPVAIDGALCEPAPDPTPIPTVEPQPTPDDRAAVCKEHPPGGGGLDQWQCRDSQRRFTVCPADPVALEALPLC